MEILRGLFRLVPREPAPPSAADWNLVVHHTMLCRRARGSEWPPGTGEDLAVMLANLAQSMPIGDVIKTAELELQRRDVGGRNTFAHGAGI